MLKSTAYHADSYGVGIEHAAGAARRTWWVPARTNDESQSATPPLPVALDESIAGIPDLVAEFAARGLSLNPPI